jgi:hypothetical protein
MASDFDVSEACKTKLNVLLKVYTIYEGVSNVTENERARQNVINNIIRGLTGPGITSNAFAIHLNQTQIKQGCMEPLFLAIANAVCRRQIDNFHYMPSKRYVTIKRHDDNTVIDMYQKCMIFSWQFLHYHVEVFAGYNTARPDIFFMRVVDTANTDERYFEEETEYDPTVIHRQMRQTQFDISDGCKARLNSLLTEYTIYNEGDENTAVNNRNARSLFVDNIIRQLREFSTPAKTFDLYLDQTSVTETHIADLFREIALSICKGDIKEFHHVATGKRARQIYKRHVVSWEYLHYKFKVFTKIILRPEGFLTLYKFYMMIIDTSKEQDNDAGSGNDTADDDHLTTLFILQSLHDRVRKLEASYCQPPTASARRLE